MTMTVERPAATLTGIQELEDEQQPNADQKYLRSRRWTREEYHRLGDAGFFDGERVELLNGEIWTLPPQGTPHFSAIRRSTASMEEVFGTGFEMRQQAPIVLDDSSEPEPDVVVVPGSPLDYEDHHPSPGEVRLLIEVSDSTLRKDRGEKAEDYARAGIADYWIINLVHRQLEIHRDPAVLSDGAVYRTKKILLAGETVTPLFAPGAEVSVAELFPSLTAQGSSPDPTD